jgi:CubicO group peptidase (beta-lactamase class C family)
MRQYVKTTRIRVRCFPAQPRDEMIAPLLVFSLAAQIATDSLEREHVRGAVGARIDAELRQMERDGFSGSVLVVRDRRIVLAKGYGLADPRSGHRNSPATRFEMNSITKLFTGVSILQLADVGRLRLADPVERHLGAFPTSKGKATIEQLASHVAGMIIAGTALNGSTLEAYIEDVKRTPGESAPGAQYRYTNAGYSLLAAIVARASGRPFEEYVRQNVFAPAKMQTAVFRNQVPANDTLFARAHVGTPNPYNWGVIGAGGIWSTVGDIYRWVAAIEDGLVVPASQRARFFAEPKPPSQEAFGWHVRAATDSTPRQIDKGGGSADFQSQLLYFPTEKVVIVWATNDLRKRWRQPLNALLVKAAMTIQ